MSEAPTTLAGGAPRPPSAAEESHPLVSIVIPSHNRGDVFGQTLDSIRAQTYPHWEAIVVDDGSTDQTPQVLQDATQADGRIRGWRRTRPTAGAPACRNEGWLASRGSLVIFLDSDDLLAPSCLERRVEVLAQHPTVGFAAFPSAIFVDRPGDTDRFWNAFDDRDDLGRFLLHDAPWQTTGPIWRRWALERIGLWDESAARWQDWEFHVRALAAGIPYVKDPTPDSFWRRSRTGSISNAEFERGAYASHTALLPKVFRLVRDAGAMTPDRRRRFTALFMYLCEHSYNTTADLTVARQLWSAASAAGVPGPLTALAGRAYLRAPKSRAGRRLRQVLLKRLIPYLDDAGRSPTRGTARVPAIGLDKGPVVPATATALG